MRELIQTEKPTQKQIKLYMNLFEETIEKYWSKDPSQRTENWIKFMHDELRYVPDKCMYKTIDGFSNFEDCALMSCHGAGKTALSSGLGLTALCLTPELALIQISPTWRQVKDIYWKELRKWYGNSSLMQNLFVIADKSPRLESRIDPLRWYALGLASDQPSKIEGQHNKRMVLMVDEAKAVHDDMIEAVQGALTSDHEVWNLYGSTPRTPSDGYTEFYKCFTKMKDSWKLNRVSAYDTPRVSQKWIDRMAKKYGVKSQVYQARVEGKIPSGSNDYLLSLTEAEEFYAENQKDQSDKFYIGLDVARYGGDETVISVWQGKYLITQEIFEKTSTTFTSKKAVEYCLRYNARAIGIDDTGIGGGVTDALMDNEDIEKAQVYVVPFLGGSRPSQEENTGSQADKHLVKFKTLGDEVYYNFAQDVKENKIKTTIDDETLVYQLASFLQEYTPNNKMVINRPKRAKQNFSEKKSPDRADSAIIGWYAGVIYNAIRDADVEDRQARNQEDPESDYDRYEESLEFYGIRNKQF